jgi:hypothetical protein
MRAGLCLHCRLGPQSLGCSGSVSARASGRCILEPPEREGSRWDAEHGVGKKPSAISVAVSMPGEDFPPINGLFRRGHTYLTCTGRHRAARSGKIGGKGER